MTNPLHAQHYADRCISTQVPIVENVEIARDTYRMRIECPKMAERFRPGQFLMARLHGYDDPLIGRPFALYDVVCDESGAPQAIDFIYLKLGKLTARMVHLSRGDPLDVWGPLGNGFVPRPCQHLIMVAGGIGQTPFLAVAKERLGLRAFGRDSHPVGRVTLVYGARTAERFAGLEDFESAGIQLNLATDDGSRGHHGLVTELLPNLLAENPTGIHVVCCGPEPMMAEVSRLAMESGIPCDVSLEEPMACGVGICFTCVARVRDAQGNCDYRRTCVEGPVFSADLVEW